MNKYLFKMFEEFKKAYGIKDTFDNFSKYQDLFANWIINKKNAATNYVQLFDYMENDEEIQTYTMAEFGKGIYDTIAIEMANNTIHQPIVISPFAETIKRDSGIEVFTGELAVCNDGDVIVKYPTEEDYATNPNCHPIFNDEIGTLMTQVPYSKVELYPFFKLIDSYKTLFIGTYGSLSDKDCEENLKRIQSLYQELCDINYRDVNFCSETQEGCYLSAIKISSRAKVLKKTLTLHR